MVKEWIMVFGARARYINWKTRIKAIIGMAIFGSALLALLALKIQSCLTPVSKSEAIASMAAQVSECIQKDKYDEGLALSDKVIQEDPNTAMHYVRRGMLYRNKKPRETDRALADFNKAIALDPKCNAAYYNRAMLYRWQNQYDAAIADCSLAIKRDPSCETYLYVERARSYLLKNDANSAFSDLNEALRRGRDSDAYRMRCKCYIDRGEYRKALDDAQDAVIYNRDDMRALYYRALCQLKLQNPAKCIDDCDLILKKLPTDSSVWILRGDAWRARGDKTKALADYRKATECDPKDTTASDRVKELSK